HPTRGARHVAGRRPPRHHQPRGRDPRLDRVASVARARVTVDPFAPAPLGPITLRNRIIKAATFEGMTRKNVPTDRLIDYHLAVAEGGVGMTTVAFCAVSSNGRGAPGEIVVT